MSGPNDKGIRVCPPNRHWTIIERIKIEKKTEIKFGKKKSENELLLEIQKLKGQMGATRKKRIDLEKKKGTKLRSPRG